MKIKLCSMLFNFNLLGCVFRCFSISPLDCRIHPCNSACAKYHWLREQQVCREQARWPRSCCHGDGARRCAMVEGKNGRTLLPSPQSSIPFSFLLLIYLFLSFLQIPLSLSLPLFFPFLLSFSSLLRICLSFSFYFCILFSLSSPCPLSPSHVQLALFPGSHHMQTLQATESWAGPGNEAYWML